MTTSLYSTAVHEAAHAVVAVRTVKSGKHALAKNGVVTIDANGSSLGSVKIKKRLSKQRKQEREIMVDLAGGIAQCRIEPPDYSELEGQLSIDSSNILSSLTHFYPALETAHQVRRHNYFVSSGKTSDWRHRDWGEQYYKHAIEPKLNSKQLAEANLLGQRVSGATTFLCAAGNDAKAAQLLMSVIPQHAAFIVKQPWFKKLGELTNQTSALLDLYWSDVHRLANRLLEVGTMTGPEAEAFIKKVPA